MDEDHSDDGSAPAGRPGEADEADVLEQQQAPTGEDDAPPMSGDLPPDVDEADALDQRRQVDVDDDGYDTT